MLMLNVAELRQAPAKEEYKVEFAPNGTDPVLSPSQVSTWLMCPRKWAAKYLHGQREQVFAGTIAGKKMHSVLEDYYATGRVPGNDTPEGKWALALIHETGLPVPVPLHLNKKKDPRVGPVPERTFKFEHAGVWWRGSKDLTYIRDGLWVIRDHKSTSELNPLWVKTGEKLLTDPQSVIYAFEAILAEDVAEVENEWGYCTRDKYPKTDVHRVRMTWEIVQRGMEVLTQAGLEILKAYRERPSLGELPPHGTQTGGCEAFGGCKVVGCNVTALDRIRGMQLFNARKQGGADMGYLDEMRARSAQQAALSGGAEAPPSAAAAPAPEPAPPPAPATDIRSRLAAQAGAGDAVNPPPFTPPPAAAAPAPAPSAPAPATSPADAPKRGRGRARAAAAAAPAPTIPPTPTPNPDQVIQEIAQAAAAAFVPPLPQVAFTDGYTLGINCLPPGKAVVLFSQYVQQVHDALRETKGWPHYNIASFEGKAAFQDALAQCLQQAPPAGVLYVNARTDEGRDALPTLERFAADIWKDC